MTISYSFGALHGFHASTHETNLQKVLSNTGQRKVVPIVFTNPEASPFELGIKRSNGINIARDAFSDSRSSQLSAEHPLVYFDEEYICFYATAMIAALRADRLRTETLPAASSALDTINEPIST